MKKVSGLLRRRVHIFGCGGALFEKRTEVNPSEMENMLAGSGGPANPLGRRCVRTEKGRPLGTDALARENAGAWGSIALQGGDFVNSILWSAAVSAILELKQTKEGMDTCS